MIDPRWQVYCLEFLKGCTCTDKSKPQECEDCLRAFVDAITKLSVELGLSNTNNSYCITPHNASGTPDGPQNL